MAEANGVRLVYSVTPDGHRIDVNELVPSAYNATRFGGRRPWLMCLEYGCRCRKIYGRRYFRYRQCLRLDARTSISAGARFESTSCGNVSA
jgi:hypothetical protein